MIFLIYNHIKKSIWSKTVFDLQPYKKIDLVENWFCVKIPVFPSFFFVRSTKSVSIQSYLTVARPTQADLSGWGTTDYTAPRCSKTHPGQTCAVMLYDSERSEECIDFTMIRNNAPIPNYGGGFRCKSEYPWCIIE
ncbi:Uncharacterized protein FWK35_00000165, partial [Aphis craccivora]